MTIRRLTIVDLPALVLFTIFLIIPVNAVFSAAPEGLWVATNAQLWKLNPADGTAAASPADTANILRLAVDERLALVWAYRGDKLLAFDAWGNLLSARSATIQGSSTNNSGLAVNSNDGTVWLALNKKLSRFSSQGQFLNNFDLAAQAVALSFDPVSGLMWVATQSTLTALDGSGTARREISIAKNTNVKALAVDRGTGAVWVALKDSLQLFNPVAQLIAQKSFGGIDRLSDDGNHGIWASAGGRLTRFSATLQTLIDIAPLSKSNSVNVLVSDPVDQSLWVGTDKSISHLGSLGFMASASLASNINDAVVLRPMTAANRPPVANNDTALTPQGTPITITVLGNDSDPDGDPINIVSITQPQWGTATHNGVTVTYTPPAIYSGVQTFNYTIADNRGGISGPALVSVTVNQPPQVNAGPDQTVTIASGAKLAGSVIDDGYPVGGTLTKSWSKLNGPVTGIVTFANANSPATMATFSETGVYVLRLTASDGSLTRSADVQITVDALPTVWFSVAAASVAEDNTSGKARLTVSRTGATTGALTVNYTVGGGATPGTAAVGGDYITLPGSVIIQAGQSSANIDIVPLTDNLIEGDESIVVTLSANAGVYTIGSPSSATATIIDVPPVAPLQISPATLNGILGQPFSQGLAATGGKQPYEWSLVAGSLPDVLSLSPNGTISGTPTVIETATFTAQVKDAKNTIATKSLSLRILPVFASGLLGYWSFDDGSAKDNSGNGNNGVLVNGPTPTTGKSGQALNFVNQSNQYVDLGNVLNPGVGDFSVFAWVKVNQTTVFNMTISKRDASVVTNSGYQLFMLNNKLSFALSDGSAPRLRVDSSGPLLNDGNWHLVGAVFTRAGNGVLYVDGTPAPGGSASIAAFSGAIENTLSMRIGAEQGGFNWDGEIDEVRFYNRALSGQEVLNLFNAPASPLAILNDAFPNGEVNGPYGPQALTALGGSAGYAWTITNGSLPQGITLDPNGSLTGMPTSAGTSNFTLQVQDAQNATVQKAFSITVDLAVLKVTSKVLLNAVVNQPHTQTLAASSGTPPYVWSIVGGSLPPGLSLAADGTITGTPYGIGSSKFLAQVKDAANATASAPLLLTVLSSARKPLVGYWSFDDGTATDNSGFQDDGELVNNPTFVPGKFGSALRLNGIDQYVNIDQFAKFGSTLDAGSGDFSVFAWVKTTQTGGSKTIIAKRDSSVISNPGYQLFQNSNNSLSFVIGGGGSSAAVRVDSTGPVINDGNWHLVGAVFSRHGDGVLYFDGQRAINGSADISSQAGNSANFVPLRIGAEQQTDPAFLWDGDIDEVRVFTRRAFTDAEVLAMYHNTLTIVSDSLPVGGINVPYSQQLTGTGGAAPRIWSLAAGSTLPSGMSLDPTGLLHGSTTTAGTYNFTVKLADQVGNTSKDLTLTINNPVPQELFSDHFPGVSPDWSKWGLVDQGTEEGPANWIVTNGDFIQTTNTLSGAALDSDPLKLGTYVITTYPNNVSSTDYDIAVRLMAEDNDSLGVMFRYQGVNNYYRFSIDAERGFRRLLKLVGGAPIILQEDYFRYEIGRSYLVRISVVGSSIKIYMDNQLIFDVIDGTFLNGTVALYCWGNEFSHFGDVLITH